MQFNSTHSAILRGRWLVDKQWADAHMSLVFRLLKGESVDFGVSQPKLNEIEIDKWISLSSNANVYNVGPSNDLSSLPTSSIAVVNLEGPMLKRGGLCSYGMVDQASLIKDLAASPNVEGIILNIDSPGGQADGTAMLADIIKEALATKPVIAIINDGMAASAAMWIASAACEIYVTQKTDQVGSIGVYTQIADWNSYYKDFMKLNVQDIYAPQSTDKNKDYRDAITGDTAAVEQDLSVLADQFINTVAANRAGKIKGDTWKTGKMFYAKDAKKIGLIDGIKSFDQVITRTQQLIANPSPKQTSKPNKNIMSFEKTIAAAKATSFAVTDEGFALDETMLNNVEAEITRLQGVETELSVANTALTAAEGTLAIANAAVDTAKADLATANASVLTSAGRITDLEAQVATLGAKPSGSGTTLNATEDEPVVTPKIVAHANDNSPENVWADKHMRKSKKPTV